MAFVMYERAASAREVVLLANYDSDAGMSKTRGNGDAACTSTYSHGDSWSDAKNGMRPCGHKYQ